MQTPAKIMCKNPNRNLVTVSLAVAAILFGSLAAEAQQTVNVSIDHNQNWAGYQAVSLGGAYSAGYLGAGGAPDIQGTISASDVVRCAPDLRMDKLFNTDTMIWADDTGLSDANPGVTVDSTYYVDTGSIAVNGDTVIFSAQLLTNLLATAYSDSIVAFIKDFDSGWGWHGMVTVNLNTLTNGEVFSISKVIEGDGSHVQYGFEWVAPPARTNPAAFSYVGNLGSITISNSLPAQPPGANTINVYIDPSQTWQGFENYYNQAGLNPGGYWYGSGRAAADVQGSISGSGTVLCAPDIWVDKNNPANTDYWYDSTGSSTGVCNVVSTFYIDRTGIANTDDLMVFTGTLVTNGLAEPYTNSIVAFIKEFNSTWGGFSMASVNLNTLTNGEQFTVSKTILNDSSGHFQWGFEWSGPPARTNDVANLGFAVLSSNAVATAGPQVIAISPGTANVTLGSNQTFTAVTSGSSLTYQWKLNGANLTDGPGISGSTTNRLSLSGVQCIQEGTYSLVVTDSGGLKATNYASMVVYNPGWLYFDRALAPFNGYINVWNGANLISSPPESGDAGTAPGASFGFGVTPTTLLRASMDTANDVITLQPNTYVFDGATNSMDPAYINPDGTSAAYLEQDYYIVNDDLAGQTLTFAGYCVSNSLDSAYTARAWIKDASPSWGVEHRYDTNLVAGQPFILTVPTTPGNHVQYGFGLWGPANSGTNPITQGAVVVRVYSPLTGTRSGGNMNLEFPTVINHSYTVQYKTNLTDSSWNSLSTTNGTGRNVTVPDATSAERRFYRLSTQ